MWNLRRPFLFPHNQYNNLCNQLISTHRPHGSKVLWKKEYQSFIRTAEKYGNVGSSISPECLNNVKCGSLRSLSTAGDSQGVGIWSVYWNTRRVYGGVKPAFCFVAATPESIDSIIKLLKSCCMPASVSWNVSIWSGSSSSRRKADQQKVFQRQRQLYYSAIRALIPICRVKLARESCFWQLFVM